MACVSITITHHRWTDPKNAYIAFHSSVVDGRYAEGSQAWGWGGYPKLTDTEYLEQKAIPHTLSYLAGNFQRVYGREMKRTDICGQEGYKTEEQIAAQILYDEFRSGYRWDSFGAKFTYECNTCYPNKPPGFSDTRPAGGSTYTYTGYGKTTTSLDEAWDIYIKAVGGQEAPATPGVEAPTIWTIKGEKGMTGTVESNSTGVFWHIKSPVVLDVWYGVPGHIPATWIDPDTNTDQMAVIEYEKGIAFLDKGLSGGIGEINSLISDLIITNIGNLVTRRISIKEASAPTVWTIKGERGMTGTVEQQAGWGLLWHITSPVVLDVWYGGQAAIPYTYVDSSGRDQMAVVDTGWAYFDHNYTGDLGEISVPVSEVITSFPNGTTFTGRISLKEAAGASEKPPETYTYILIGVILIAAIYLLARR